VGRHEAAGRGGGRASGALTSGGKRNDLLQEGPQLVLRRGIGLAGMGRLPRRGARVSPAILLILSLMMRSPNFLVNSIWMSVKDAFPSMMDMRKRISPGTRIGSSASPSGSRTAKRLFPSCSTGKMSSVFLRQGLSGSPLMAGLRNRPGSFLRDIRTIY